MGTRALTIVEENDKDLVVIYRQFDGYPSGHGAELASFLEGRKVTNGITGEPGKWSNGMGCLAAELVMTLKLANQREDKEHNKTHIGGIYIEEAGSRNMGEQYRYIIYPDMVHGSEGGKEWEACVLRVKVQQPNFDVEGTDDWKVVFDGTTTEYSAWVVEQTALENAKE